MPDDSAHGEIKMIPVDTTDGQVPEEDEWADFLTLNISGRDKVAYVLSFDTTSDYRLSGDSLPQADVPTGQLLRFRHVSSVVYPGVERDVWLYLPSQANGDRPVNLLVCLDGPLYFGPQVNATTVLDNLIYRQELPVTAGLFIAPGETGPGYPFYGGSDNRSIEYDSVASNFARFVDEELLPMVRSCVTLTDDPAGRAICGFSSGGAAAVTAGFLRPDLFGNAISHCGSFVNVRGAHQLPTMIRQTPRKSLRVWHQTGSRDLDIIFGNLQIANRDLAASLQYRRYDTAVTVCGTAAPSSPRLSDGSGAISPAWLTSTEPSA